VTSPPDPIRVVCPECGTEYADWQRSVNVTLEGWDVNDPEVQAYLRECETATCPSCGFVVELEGVLRVEGDTWIFS